MSNIYEVLISTCNPSADVSGYFDSKKAVNKAIERFKIVVKESPDYYGEIKNVEVREIVIGNNLN